MDADQLRDHLEKQLSVVRAYIRDTDRETREHAARNREQMFGILRADIDDIGAKLRHLRKIVEGDGNGTKGIRRELDSIVAWRERMEDTLSKINDTLDRMNRRTTPPKSKTLGPLQLTPETIRAIAIVGAIVSAVLGKDVLLDPGGRVADVQAEAVVEMRAELERMRADLLTRLEAVEVRERQAQ